MSYRLESDIDELVTLGILRHALTSEGSLAQTLARIKEAGIPTEQLNTVAGMDLDREDGILRNKVDEALVGVDPGTNENGQRFIALVEGLDEYRASSDEVRITAAALRDGYGEMISALDDWFDDLLDRAAATAAGQSELAAALRSIQAFAAYIDLLNAALDEPALLLDYVNSFEDALADRNLQVADSLLTQDAAIERLRRSLPPESLEALEAALALPASEAYQANRGSVLVGTGLVIDNEGEVDFSSWGGLSSLAGPMVDRFESLQVLIDPVAEEVTAATAEARADAQEGILQSFLIIAMITLATLILVLLTVRSVGSPLSRLEDRARRMGSGEVHLEPLGPRGPREVAVVAESFDRVMRHLTIVDAQAAALAENDLDRPVLAETLPGPLGRSMRKSVDNLSSTNARLRESEGRANSVIDTAPDAIFILGQGGIIERVNDSAASLVGVDAEDLLGRPLMGTWLEVDDLDDPEVHELQRTEGTVETSAGLAIPVMVSASTNPDSTDERTTVILRDISGRKRLENELAHQAHHDSLTGLPNRAYALQTLGRALSHARRSALDVAVLFVDLDRFKAVNDTFGHRAGDWVLQTLAGRLQSTLRSSEIIARLGGDEFLVVATGLDNPAAAVEIGRRLEEQLTVPIDLDGGNVITMEGSIGISYSPCGIGEPDDLIRNADTAAYQAKASRTERIQLFDTELSQWLEERKSIELSVRTAIDEGQLDFHYQPIVDAETGQLVMFEALARWHHPDRGMLGPDQFLPIIEESHMVIEMGRWAIERACTTLAAWADVDAAISINVSGRHLLDGDVAGDLAEALERTGARADRVVIELTERQILDHLRAVAPRLEAVRAMGVRIALDDFGSGYSALSSLRLLPIDLVKIDRRFVAGIAPENDQAHMLEFFTQFATTLDIEVVGVGVETPDQISLLSQLGCTFVQGFEIARPLTATAARAWMDDRLRRTISA